MAPIKPFWCEVRVRVTDRVAVYIKLGDLGRLSLITKPFVIDRLSLEDAPIIQELNSFVYAGTDGRILDAPASADIRLRHLASGGKLNQAASTRGAS